MVINPRFVLKHKFITGRNIGNGDGLVEVEGAAIDVRVGEVWQMKRTGKGYLYKETRKSKEYDVIAKYKIGKSIKAVIKPGEFYQFKTIEKIHVPDYAVARFIARYNLLVNGIFVLGYKADPGFEGEFVFPVVNLSTTDFEIELGARVAQFEFHEIKGKINSYRGQWKNGRVYIKKEEKQV